MCKQNMTWKRVFGLGAVFVLCLSLILGCSDFKGNHAMSDGGISMEMVVLDIGKADAILIQTEEWAVLVDAGEKENSDAVLDYLHEQEVTYLDFLILTHLDKDHIGGAAQILKEIPTGTVIQSANDEDSKAYKEFRKICHETGLKPVKLQEAMELPLQGVDFRLLPAGRGYYESDNDYSIIAELYCGDYRFLLTGDAGEKRIGEYLEGEPQTVDVLKMPHHGRLSGYSKRLIQTVEPEYAVITCSEKNPPDAEILELLMQEGTIPYLTQKGAVRFYCDGSELTVEQ